MQMTFKVRLYQATDEAAVADLLERVLPDAQPHNAPRHVLAMKQQHDNLMLVAEISSEAGREIGGFVIAGFDGHRGWIYQLAVEESQRQQGIGRSLVEEAVDRLTALGCNKVNLQIRADNAAVARFYESLGFAIEDRISMGRLITPA